MKLFSDNYCDRQNRRVLSQAEWNLQKRQFRRSRKSVFERGEICLNDVASRDALYAAYRFLRKNGGQSPGEDGVIYSDISPSEMGDILGEVSVAIRSGTYQTMPTLEVRKLKRQGGYRTLKIGVVVDRIVGRALYAALEPAWDSLFSPRSYGFRTGKSVLHLLADLQLEMEQTDSWVLAIDDVKQAFDNVRLDEFIRRQNDAQRELAGDVQQPVRITDEVLMHAVRILRGSDQNRTLGIDQGGSYSPIALNLMLHYVHDLPLCAVGLPSWYRYADNLVYLVPDVSSGQQVRSTIGLALNASGLSLKGTDDVTDLNIRGSTVSFLGFEIRRTSERQLAYRPAGNSITSLCELLVESHGTAQPEKTARRILLSWIRANGPAYQRLEPLLSQLTKLAQQCGFREISSNSVKHAISEAGKRWQQILIDSRRTRTANS